MKYVRNAWYVAQWSCELPAGTPQAMQILGEPIVLWRTDGGTVHALEDRCAHRLAPLSLGRVEQGNLRCMYHGFVFNSEGRVIAIPSQDTIPAAAKAKHYAVAEQDGWVWVWMGAPERADRSLIPRVTALDDPDWAMDHGTLDYAAEARLINDNLTDLSHLAFVHAESFASTEDLGGSVPTVTPIERGVRIERWTESQPPVGVPKEQADPSQLLDVLLSTDYFVPGVMSLKAFSYPAGTFKRLGRVNPPEAFEIKEVTVFSSQAVTPTGPGKARYFFSNGLRAQTPAEARAFVWNEVVLKAFAEDRMMIEGQQRILDATPAPRLLLAAGDMGTVAYNRLVERLVQDETETQPAATLAA